MFDPFQIKLANSGLFFKCSFALEYPLYSLAFLGKYEYFC